MIQETLIKEINKLKIKEKPIAIQIPEGLKQYSTDILNKFKENDPILFVDQCYGACDLKDIEAKNLGCKLLIHFGHYPVIKSKIKTIYIPLNYELDNETINYIVEEIKKLNLKKINLVTTIQYINNIEKIKTKLKQENIQTLPGKKTKRTIEHVVLGCDCSTINDKTYPIIFIGDGYFHVTNIAYIYNSQKIYLINPFTKDTKQITEPQEFIKRRYAIISRAKNAQSFGIIVSTKPGQTRLKLAKNIQNKLQKQGKKAYLLIADNIKDELFTGINIDCYINTACPRITYDDYYLFKKPMLAPPEIELLFNIYKKLEIDQMT